MLTPFGVNIVSCKLFLTYSFLALILYSLLEFNSFSSYSFLYSEFKGPLGSFRHCSIFKILFRSPFRETAYLVYHFHSILSIKFFLIVFELFVNNFQLLVLSTRFTLRCGFMQLLKYIILYSFCQDFFQKFFYFLFVSTRCFLTAFICYHISFALSILF